MRRPLAALRDVRESLASRPGRVALALLALFTGSFALVLLSGVMRGLERRAETIEADFGLNAFAITAADDAGTRGRGADLPAEVVRRLESAAPRLLAAGVRGSRAQTRAGDTALQVSAMDPALSAIRPFRLRSGRLLDGIDARERARVAVISSALRARFGWDTGATLYIGAEPFEIVGVADFPTSAGAAATDALFGEANGVLVPAATPAYWLADDAPSDRPHAVWVRYPAELGLERAVDWTRQLLSGNGLNPSDFHWITADALLEPVRKWRAMIRITAGSVALFCLLLGGAVLMSLMVANVQERVPEIGLRRSLGATRGSIARLFMAEALALTAVAALAGAVAAAPLGRLAWLEKSGLPFAYDAVTAGPPLAVTLLLGLLFAAAPAWRASRVEPAEALRAD